PMGYAVLRHEAITKVLRERRFHHLLRLMGDVRQLDPRLTENRRQNILTAEGDEHQRLRRLVSPAFTPKSAERLRPTMQATMNALIDHVADRGHVEAIEEICEPYPIPIICELLGAPKQDWQDFSRWAQDVLSGLDADANDKVDIIVTARDELDCYVRDLIARRRTEPEDDLLTDLIAANTDGDSLSDDELLTMVEAVLVAGVDTTRNQLGCALSLFADHPDQWTALADDPTLAPRAVEEVMRFQGAVRGTGRYADEDIEIDDVIFPKGTLVFPAFTSGNRDANVHEAPDTFDMKRESPVPQLTFGSGVHFCLGAFLARAELQEALPLLATRLPDLSLAEPATWKPPTAAIFGPERLQLNFTPTSA
ncbi:MAG: cytochrome P450, partial [Actinomycetota bacterium]|nr:cytochrome P450 [Actinomycetota bacterium]